VSDADSLDAAMSNGADDMSTSSFKVSLSIAVGVNAASAN